jgi:hypothetical protein
MDDAPLTFAELDRRLAAAPDGPAALFSTPRWLVVANVVGMAGVVLGLLPGIVVFALPAQPWMAGLARGGLVVAVAAFALPFVRAVVAFAASSGRWRHDQARQLDHELAQFRALLAWLAAQPPERVDALLAFCRHTRERLGERLALLGGVEKLGLLPILVGVALHARAVMETIRTASWEAPVGVFLVLLYGAALVGNLLRQRLRLYEALLERAVDRCA